MHPPKSASRDSRGISREDYNQVDYGQPGHSARAASPLECPELNNRANSDYLARQRRFHHSSITSWATTIWDRPPCHPA